jgi:ketosteroid isomerase-like protein
MKRLLVLILAVVMSSVLVAADPADGVREAGAGWRQGAIKQDKALLQRYLADDLVYTHGGGQSETKAEYMANVLKGPSHYESMTPSATKIRLYGKTAVLTGLVDIKPPKGELYRVRTLEVYTQNTNGDWQMAQKESVRVPLK